jgi:N-acetylglucosaminyldiphosphoundecaprenol N-acetyl-beta-D-mannosaminyltransferase
MRGAAEAGSWQARWRQTVGALRRVDAGTGESQLLDELARPAGPMVLAFVNAHAMNLAARSRPFHEALQGADVVVRDGSGMALLLRMLHMPPGVNLNGTDLIPRICERYAGRTIALFGTREPYLGRAAAVVRAARAPGGDLVTADGFLPAQAYLTLAAQHRPDLIVLGMGMPRQEEVARELRAALRHPCLIVCGGAIIDFLGGRTPRAPRWLRAAGSEWLYRLALEPRRLFRRYVIGNPLFMARALVLARRLPLPQGQTRRA